MNEGTRLEVEIYKDTNGLRIYEVSPSESARVLVKGQWGGLVITLTEDEVRVVHGWSGHGAIKRKGSRTIVIYAEPHRPGEKHKLLTEGVKEAA